MSSDKIRNVDIEVYDDYMMVYTSTDDEQSPNVTRLSIQSGEDIVLNIPASSSMSDLLTIRIESLRTDDTTVIFNTDSLCSFPLLREVFLHGLYVEINRPDCIIRPRLEVLHVTDSVFQVNTPDYENVLEMIHSLNPNMQDVVIVNTDIVGAEPDWSINDSRPQSLTLDNNMYLITRGFDDSDGMLVLPPSDIIARAA